MVLVAGGNDSTVSISESYHPDARTWSTTARLATLRSSQTPTTLSSGFVLVAGRFDLTNILVSAKHQPPLVIFSAGVRRLVGSELKPLR